jgi:hypothetical protein
LDMVIRYLTINMQDQKMLMKDFLKKKEYLNRAYVDETDYLSMTFRDRTYRPLYKQKRLKKENGVVYVYTVPKTFSIENKYKQFRL